MHATLTVAPYKLTHPAVRNLFLEPADHPAFRELLRSLAAGGSPSLSGLTTTAKALYAVLLWQEVRRPLVVVVDGNKEAETLFEILNVFFALLASDARYGPQLLPAPDVIAGQRLSPHAEISEQRAIGLWRLASGQAPITIPPGAAARPPVQTGDYYPHPAPALQSRADVSVAGVG